MAHSWKKIAGITAGVLLALGIAGRTYYNNIFEEYSKKGGIVLEYHSVSDHVEWGESMVVSAKTFEQELKAMSEHGYHMVTVEQLGERLRTGQSVEKYVALSFDDGYKDNYTTALPLLKKYNAKATFFIIGNRIGASDLYMNEAEINAMLDAGMEIGSHTLSHNPLGEIDPKYLDWEIGSSQYLIEKRFPKAKVRSLAYPNGSYNDQIIAKLKQFGYHQAMTGHTGMNDHKLYKEHPMELNRVIVFDNGKGPLTILGLLIRGYRRSLFLTWGIDIGE